MNLRSRLSTLIAVRVVVSTLLLGSAILVQLNRPGAFPVDPFFFLIGLTYALSVLYLAIAPLRRAPPLDRRRAARRRRDARLGVHSRHRRHHQLLLVALPAADHGGQHGAVPARRAAGGGAQRGAVPRARVGAVPRADGVLPGVVAGAEPAGAAVARGSRSTRSRSTCSGSSRWRCWRGRWPSTCDRRAPASSDASHADRRPARVQPVRHRQPAERPGHRRHGRPDPHVQPRGRDDHRPERRPGRSAATSARCCSCPHSSAGGCGRSAKRAASAPIISTAARRPR